MSQAPRSAKPAPIASTAMASAANTQARPAGEIEQLRLRVRLKPRLSSRNGSSRRTFAPGDSRLGMLTEARKLPQEKARSQGKSLNKTPAFTSGEPQPALPRG